MQRINLVLWNNLTLFGFLFYTGGLMDLLPLPWLFLYFDNLGNSLFIFQLEKIIPGQAKERELKHASCIWSIAPHNLCLAFNLIKIFGSFTCLDFCFLKAKQFFGQSWGFQNLSGFFSSQSFHFCILIRPFDFKGLLNKPITAVVK